ncbi:MAG TPA: FtsX-like permease family protein [Flavobacterium sp.]|jgi:putative ABC transport system permease protein
MIAKIAWRNIIYKPLNTILSLILLSAAVAIISLIILLQQQFENKFSKNIEAVDLVLGASGSPLQLILSSVYQMDAPTGNINYEEAKVWMNHPFVKKAIPLAFGDNYNGYKIVGTTETYIEKYDGKFSEGKIFRQNFEVVVGSEVANKMKLRLGSTFYSSHGESAEGEKHENADFIVVGILQPTGNVIDNLVLCSIQSVWGVHQQEASEEHHEEEITAVLFELRNKMAFVMWPRMISQNTKMQMASPAIEINRLFTLFGFGLQALQYLAYGIMLISGISIFIALYNTLKERKYEFALLRVSGAGRSRLLALVLWESMFLCVTGFILGTIFGRIALWYISSATEDEYKMAFDPFQFVWQKEGVLFAVTIFVGIVAALIPAIKAYRIDISKTLSNA